VFRGSAQGGSSILNIRITRGADAMIDVDKVEASFGLGSKIGYGSFVGWVEHPDIFCWISFLNPTYLPAIFMLSAKPNKMAEDRAIPRISKIFG
jgi:hypothetical protein